MAELHSVDEALNATLSLARRMPNEQCLLHRATGRVLACDIHATIDMPPFDNSAMDGYALRARDGGQALTVSQRIPAGHAPSPLEAGTCARIFTGARLPEGADTVIMQEQVEITDEGQAVFTADLPVSNNIRQQGGELRRGNRLLAAGACITPAALGLLASQGLGEITVVQRPRIALLTSGDEVILPGRALAEGQIYNSNRYQLAALIEQFGGELVAIDHLPDQYDASRQALEQYARQADIIVTAGGVSVGEEDHVRHAIEAVGQVAMWRLAMKPGKPLTLGHIGNTAVIGLAGNPVSGFVSSYLFLRPLIGSMLGCPAMSQLRKRTVSAGFETRTNARCHYLRVVIDEHGKAHLTGAQDSSMLSSCVDATALAVIDPHRHIQPGDDITCLELPG
ncbi:molybdopterin molybdotransferase MoeA [Larsenimonas rhizosphaerae]|uniref:Molybdopterin molybdenumtransferase n=1 Tax=Larsenimonas rhizosphaerae TaxID=2944682 RepID=A0AA41ZDL1_9GAMM|nr:gephyrin-like molybdotransferase Glp [Larsenimonas rhizosphaerae]MCX2523344.1 molybdopterin molybdotransferase MoeA [Larsenimonas rhizosphaerae]